MYPFAQLREAWETLYRTVAVSVAERFPDTPTELSWQLGAHESWLHPRLALGQTCGWPLVTTLKARVRVIGTFAHVVDGVSSHMSRSIIIARHARALDDLVDVTAAVNSADSLTGYISLLAACGLSSGRWPGAVEWTGAHLASIDAVRREHADVASIDALTWAYQHRVAPHTLEGLIEVGRGPLVPGLPLIVSGDADDAIVAAWRSSFEHALLDPQLVDTRDTLLIGGFVPLELADYERAVAPYTSSS
jgi:ABC-type phosphate/phosphonate transport system substrate-binding protein